MTTKIGFIGDLHFHHKNYVEMSKALSAAVDVMLAEDVDYVVQLGDVFDHYNISTGQTSVASIVEAVKAPLHRLWKSGRIVTYIIEGNHDQGVVKSLGGEYQSSIDLLADELKNIRVITNWKTLWGSDLGGVTMMCLPWKNGVTQADIDEFQKRSGKSERFTILAGHFTLEGATHFGHEIVDSEFYLTQEQLDSFGADLNIAGHIHHRQSIYPGIIMHDSLKDSGAPTGIRICEIDPVKRQLISDKFVELNTPQYKLIEIETNDTNYIKEIIAGLDNFHRYVIRVLNKRAGNIATPSNVKIEYKPPSKVTNRTGLEKEKMEKMTMIDMFELWAQRSEYDPELISQAISKLKNSNIQ